MRVNYHTHTFRCRHASGTEREFIEEAIKGGIELLGFSDHSPMPFPASYESSFRMKMSELDDYCNVLTSLKKEYASDIEIHIGLEAEYYPLYFDKLLDFIKDYPVEYMIQGQHCLYNEHDGFGSGFETTDIGVLKQYVKQCCEGMKSGKFVYLAHPDLINYVGSREVYRSEMRKLCTTAKELNMPLEINMLGIKTGRWYPNEMFWELAAEEGNRVIIGIDCHHTDMMILPDAEERAREIVKKYNLELTEKVELKL